MGFFTKLGSTINGSTDDEEEPSEERSQRERVEQPGPNFMPEKQKSLYLKACKNASDLSSTGVCNECGTTLAPIKAERLFASCKNEDCENHLREKELAAVKRYEDRHGVPDEVDSDEDPLASQESSDGDDSALDGLSDAIGDE